MTEFYKGLKSSTVNVSDVTRFVEGPYSNIECV